MLHLRREGWSSFARPQSRHFNLKTASQTSIAKILKTRPAQPEEVVVNGYIGSIRKLKEKTFASIIDGSSFDSLQAVFSPDQPTRLTNGTAVRLRGLWTPSIHPKEQSHELQVSKVELFGPSEPETFPLQKKYVPIEQLRTMPHMRVRLPYNSLLLRFRSQAIAEFTKFFTQQDFVQAHTPIITSSDCEGAGEVFEISSRNSYDSQGKAEPFFKSSKYLTVSAQLHLEALAQSVGKVWTLSPTFRAEKSETARHQSEFYMLEAEVAFEERLESIMDLVELMIRSVTQSLLATKVGEEMMFGRAKYQTVHEVASRSAELHSRWQSLLTHDSWPRITYTSAIAILRDVAKAEGFEVEPQWGSGLQADHERYLAKAVGKMGPVFVTDYPRTIKPFYMLSPGQDSDTVRCFDLLVPHLCEIAGGSLREHRLDNLLESMRRDGLIASDLDGTKNEALSTLQWYVDLRRWGSIPHGGFGLGFDRLLAYLTGVQNIRDVVTFPRWVGRCDC